MRRVVTMEDVPREGVLHVPPGAIFTPSARDLAAERGIQIVELASEEIARLVQPDKKIAIGSDHGGFQMKQHLKPVLDELGWTVIDIGVFEEKAADYPDIAHAVARLVAEGKAALGILVDGAGIGSSMAANKVPGIRAALCYDRASARNSREHNHANVLTLGGRMLTESQAEDVLRTWLATPFGGGRHQGRIDKITEIERAYSTWNAQNSKA
ncbi:ribose 5-phosphate isomerase B [Paludibaculum fermentans]|nr:ribose 5-phosphate isomerase B [Paludibaculum fermentans]